MSTSQATYHDAELILKLYDLRREPVMRQARDFVATFAPTSIDELMAVTFAFGTKENAYVRQVLGYWEMVASLIVHGTLNAELAQDTLGEMNFVYAPRPALSQGDAAEAEFAGIPAERRESSRRHSGGPRAPGSHAEAHGRVRAHTG